MTRKKKFKKVLIIVVVLSPLWLWLWFHPIEKALAEMRFESYIAEQNVPEDDIKTKEIMRDAKRNVYEITVTYKSDPKHIYVYTYSPLSCSLFWCSMWDGFFTVYIERFFDDKG